MASGVERNTLFELADICESIFDANGFIADRMKKITRLRILFRPYQHLWQEILLREKLLLQSLMKSVGCFTTN